ncbi:MAG: hypothetical protein ACFFCD_05035 [Promethearchaeota archaeon]
MISIILYFYVYQYDQYYNSLEEKSIAIEIAEYNTIVTMLGMLCATAQVFTGYYATYVKKRMFLVRGNDILFRSHRAFGSFATVFYFLGLFAGLTGFAGTVTENIPPLELEDPLYIIHTFGSFVVLVIIVAKTYLSYFSKKFLYGRVQGRLGVATFLAWAFTWITAAIAYYERTLPTNPQHTPPSFLLPYELMGLMLVIPFIIGGSIGSLVVIEAKKIEDAKTVRKVKS